MSIGAPSRLMQPRLTSIPNPPFSPSLGGRVRLGAIQPPSALAVGLALLSVFMIYSRSLETISLATGVYIPFLLSALLILVLLVSVFNGSINTVLSVNRSLRYFLLFSVWMLICSVFSYWKGGSFKLLVFTWLPVVTGLMGTSATIRAPESFRQLAAVLGISAAVISFFTVVLGRFDVDDRLRMGGGTLANSNDLALLILVGLPFLFLFLLDRSWGILSKIVALVSIPLAILAILRTGSRASLLALLISLFFMFVFSYGANRIKLIVMVMVVGAVAGVSLTDRVATRLKTLFQENEHIVEATASATHRKEKLMESVTMTFSHPLFGVGPGVHDVAQAEVDTSSGQRPDWQVSHNSFTQVSSETGLLGFLLYLAALMGPLWRLWRARAALFKVPALEPYRYLLSVFLISGLCLLVTNVFGSNAYLFYMPMMMVLIDNAGVMARQLVAEARAAVPAPVPVGKPAIPRPRTAATVHRPISGSGQGLARPV